MLSVALTPDGQWVLSGSKDRGVQFWDPNTGHAQLMLQGHKNSGKLVTINTKDIAPSAHVATDRHAHSARSPAHLVKHHVPRAWNDGHVSSHTLFPLLLGCFAQFAQAEDPFASIHEKID